MITFEAPFLPRETAVDAALADTAASGQARPTIVELFGSPLPAGALDADHSPPRAGEAVSRQRGVM